MTSHTKSSAIPRTVRANGATLFINEIGEGRPLILLHGGMFTGEFWLPMAPHFGEGYRLLALDSRGHGRSNNPAGRLSYRLMADDVAALIQELDLDKPPVCGYSDGGKICLELAIHHGDVVGPLVVGADRLHFTEEYVAMVRQLSFISDGDQPDIARFETTYPDQCAAFSAQHGHVYGPEHWKTLFRWSVEMYLQPFEITEEQLAAVTTPMLIVCGDRDTDFPVEESLALYRATPTAEMAVVPGANHYFPYFRPEVLPPMVREFLQRHQE